MQKSNEEWWECTNRMCGHTIQFITLGRRPSEASPTCFCGSSMKRPYVKPHCSEYATGFAAGSGAGPAASAINVSIQWFVLPLAMNSRLPARSDAS